VLRRYTKLETSFRLKPQENIRAMIAASRTPDEVKSTAQTSINLVISSSDNSRPAGSVSPFIFSISIAMLRHFFIFYKVSNKR